MFIDCSDSCVLHFKCGHSITGNYSTLFHNNARHTGDHVPMARRSTLDSILNRNYVTKGNLTSSATLKSVVYVGSDDNNVCAVDSGTGVKVWSYKTGSVVAPLLLSPTESFTLKAGIAISIVSMQTERQKYKTTRLGLLLTPFLPS